MVIYLRSLRFKVCCLKMFEDVFSGIRKFGSCGNRKLVLFEDI